MRNTGFEAKVLTHLEYIKEKLEAHDVKIEELIRSFSVQIKTCDKRFDCIDKDIAGAKGIAKGAIAVGSVGVGTGILSWFSRLFGGN